jgi:hypothetical protein
MTSIEWLRNELVNNENIRWRGTDIDAILEQAKLLHKQEIHKVSDFWHRHPISKPIFNEYYQDTFGSKGSDDHISDISKMVDVPQQEISDEEIEMFADEELGTIRTDFDFGVIQGMKWYREQLKQRQ